MIVVYFRSSLLGSWEFCQHKTYINYVLGHLEESGAKAVLGTITHKVLETLALCKKRTQDNGKDPIDDEAMGKIAVDFDYNDRENINLLCDRSFEYYTSRSKRDYTPKDLKGIKEWTFSVLDYKEGIYDPRKREIFASEQHFDLEIKKPWAKYKYELNGQEFETNLRIKGTVDLILKVKEDTLEVVDWKTGATRKNWATGKIKEYADLCEDTQLMFYYYALKKLYPDKHIFFTIYFVRAGGPFTLCFDESHIEKMEVFIQKRSKEMWNSTLPKLLSPSQTDFRCTRLCEYYKNNWPGTDKNICKHVNEHIKTYGIQITTQELMAKNFTIGTYNAPGE